MKKLLFVRDGQILPFHFHWYKMEDIINRGGGTLKLTLYNADENEGFADTPVEVTVDGKNFTIPDGGEIFLKTRSKCNFKTISISSMARCRRYWRYCFI